MNGEFSFLEKIADNLEAVTNTNDTVRMPKEYFDENFVPYLIGEKYHRNIMAKIAELTKNGILSITLIDKDGNIATVLPSLFPRELQASNEFEADFYKANNAMLPQVAEKGVKDVMEHHLTVKSDHSWGSYLKPFMIKGTDDDSGTDDNDDDDEFTIVY